MSLDRIRYALAGRSKLIPQSLIGSLCDQTPEPLAAAAEEGRWQPGKDEQEPDRPAVSNAARDLIGRLRAENARLRHALAEGSPEQTANEATIQRLTALLEHARHEAADAIRERDDECIINEQLRERIRGLELTVASLGRQTASDGDTLELPRTRSGPPPVVRHGR